MEDKDFSILLEDMRQTLVDAGLVDVLICVSTDDDKMYCAYDINNLGFYDGVLNTLEDIYEEHRDAEPVTLH